MRARNRAPSTIASYSNAVVRLFEHAAAHELDPFTRPAVESYLADLADRAKPATVAIRYRSLQQWFKWLAAEEELDADPMAPMRPPNVPEQPVAVLTTDQLRALLAVCDGKSFEDRRDTAIVRLFVDTGMRLSELAGLRVGDLDLDVENVAVVTGKGGRVRACPFGRRTAQALDRYLRARARHPRADEPALWLGDRGKGPMTSSGVAQVVKRRSREAGIGHVHPHQFRHTFADQLRRSGVDDDSLMRLAGWRSRQMLARYGASAADSRAREVYRRQPPGDAI